MKILVTVLLMLFLSINILAHHVVIHGYVEDGKVFTESTHPNGNPVKGGSLKVFSSDGNALLEGKSDKNGEFSFKIPAEVLKLKSALKVELYAGSGHKEVWSLSFEDIAESAKNTGSLNGGKGGSLENTPEASKTIVGKVILGLAAIAIIFAILYYIKRKLKI